MYYSGDDYTTDENTSPQSVVVEDQSEYDCAYCLRNIPHTESDHRQAIRQWQKRRQSP